jgi:cytochrome c556
MRQAKLLPVVAGALLLVASVSPHLFAQEEVISKRKNIMGVNNKDIKAIDGAAKEKDFATIQLKAKDIMAGLDAAASLFPAGSDTGKTRAHPDVWAKPDEFKSRLVSARKAAEALARAAEAKNEADVNTRVKELGNNREGACGACHKVFRSDFRKDG